MTETNTLEDSLIKTEMADSSQSINYGITAGYSATATAEAAGNSGVVEAKVSASVTTSFQAQFGGEKSWSKSSGEEVAKLIPTLLVMHVNIVIVALMK